MTTVANSLTICIVIGTQSLTWLLKHLSSSWILYSCWAGIFVLFFCKDSTAVIPDSSGYVRSISCI